MTAATFTHFHFCGGSGGAAIGMSQSSARVGNFEGKAECIGGVDNDPAACRDFERLVGVKQACQDLFDRSQYEDFHGKVAPESWREVGVDDIRRAAGGRSPDIVVISAPCKGLSKLLSAKRASTPKYRALNRLVLRCVHLALTAWEDDPPSLFLIENVPAISTRGRALLDQVQSLLMAGVFMWARRHQLQQAIEEALAQDAAAAPVKAQAVAVSEPPAVGAELAIG